jgi:hypothetical protein
LVTDLRVHRNLHQPGQPTLERRTPNNPPPPQPQGKGGDTGDQPPVLGHPNQNPNQNQ